MDCDPTDHQQESGVPGGVKHPMLSFKRAEAKLPYQPAGGKRFTITIAIGIWMRRTRRESSYSRSWGIALLQSVLWHSFWRELIRGYGYPSPL